MVYILRCWIKFSLSSKDTFMIMGDFSTASRGSESSLLPQVHNASSVLGKSV